MSKKLLCPSMMCANFANLEKDTKDLEVAGVDILSYGYHGWFLCSQFWNGPARL